MDQNEAKNSSVAKGSKGDKEPFSKFFTRIAGVAVVISATVLLTGKAPKSLENYAEMALRYAIGSWGLFVAAPHLIKYGWKNKGAIKEFMKRPQKSSDPVTVPASEGRNSVSSVQAPATAATINASMPLPAPFDQLPTNPRPMPSGVLTKESANDRISTALQLAGFTLDSELEVLSIEVGPTLQTVAIRLPPKIQLSQLVKKKEDLANHFGQHTGFDIKASSFQSAAAFVIPNENRAFVYMRDIAPDFLRFSESAQLPMMLGKDTKGNPKFIDLAKAPHLLVAGTTGSGKSVAVNTGLASLLSVRSPKQLKLLLLDPKMVEFKVFNGMPHLLEPTITDFRRVGIALNKVVVEMDRRYERLAECGVRNIAQYNRKMKQEGKYSSVMEYIVVVTDEYADLMMVIGAELEDAVTRIAQKARACGIHIILATQRPSVDVVTGLLKSNIPSRIAFQLKSVYDFKTVMDTGGPQLLGNGDGVFMLNGGGQERFQSAAISIDDDESISFIETLKIHWKKDTTTSGSWPDTNTIDPDTTLVNGTTQESSGQVRLDVEIEPSDQSDMDDAGESDRYDDSEEQDEYSDFVRKVSQAGGFSATLNAEVIKYDLAAARMHVGRMVQEGLLGDFDSKTGMRPYIKEEQATEEQTDLMEKVKEYICLTGSAKSDEIRDVFRIRKEVVVITLRALAEEGFLNLPTSARAGYSIAWDEEQVQEFLTSRRDIEI